MEPDRSNFLELNKHRGTKNYEVAEVIPHENEADYFDLDTISKTIFVNSYFEPKSKKKEEITYRTLRINSLGNLMGKFKAHSKLRDGTMRSMEYYVNWIINADTTKHKYLDPFSNQNIDDPFEFEASEKDPKKWLATFKEFYRDAKYVYIKWSDYYFKIGEKWYLMDTFKMADTLELDIKKQFPAKEDKDIRMLKLENLAPRFSIPPEERDTNLIKEIAYESDYEEEVDKGIFSYGYSAGWWYLEIYMPSGDTIPIKRYSEFKSPNLELYKVPVEHGGSEDVLFIIQKPEPIFPEQVGGMYVIRPRNPQ